MTLLILCKVNLVLETLPTPQRNLNFVSEVWFYSIPQWSFHNFKLNVLARFAKSQIFSVFSDRLLFYEIKLIGQTSYLLPCDTQKREKEL